MGFNAVCMAPDRCSPCARHSNVSSAAVEGDWTLTRYRGRSGRGLPLVERAAPSICAAHFSACVSPPNSHKSVRSDNKKASVSQPKSAVDIFVFPYDAVLTYVCHGENQTNSKSGPYQLLQNGYTNQYTKSQLGKASWHLRQVTMYQFVSLILHPATIHQSCARRRNSSSTTRGFDDVLQPLWKTSPPASLRSPSQEGFDTKCTILIDACISASRG